MNQTQINELHNSLTELHSKWTPHSGQIQLLKPLFALENRKDVFGQCGRNFGKTEAICYALWRWAKFNPESENYYFAPFQKQAKEIVWASQRLQNFGPRAWIEESGINNSELRIRFKNGSFIKVDGSDNVEAYRGIKPRGLSVFDEFKDFRPEFYDAYDPNRAAFKSPLIIIGTPPDREGQYLSVGSNYRQSQFFYHGPTEANPYISKDWLKEKRKELEARGEIDVWQREYEAIYVPGGVSKIFPMLNRSRVIEHDVIIKRVQKDQRKLQWFITADPGVASTFAVLFGCLNPYTKEWFILDEIYETEQSKMSVEQIGRRIKERSNDIQSRHDWFCVYDEAETWFSNEMLDRYQESWAPTHKAWRKKEVGLSLLKDVMLGNKIWISSRCSKLFWEMDNYYKDKNNNIPKKDDHLIDCLRYMLDAAYYSLNEETEYKEHEDENFRGARISDDFPEFDETGEMKEDWIEGVGL